MSYANPKNIVHKKNKKDRDNDKIENKDHDNEDDEDGSDYAGIVMSFCAIIVDDKEYAPAGISLYDDDFIIEEGYGEEEESYVEENHIIAMHCVDQDGDMIPFDDQSLFSFGCKIEYELGADNNDEVFDHFNSGSELNNDDDINRIKTIKIITTDNENDYGNKTIAMKEEENDEENNEIYNHDDNNDNNNFDLKTND